MSEFLIEKLSHLLRIGIIHVEDDTIFCYRKNDEHSPVYVSEELRKMLIHNMGDRTVPYIYQDEYQICYGVIREKNVHFFIGPVALEQLSTMNRRAYYRKWNITEEYEKWFPKLSSPELLEIMVLFSKIITGVEYTEEELIQLNHMSTKNREQLGEEKELYFLEESEREEYRHTYQEEKELMELVRNGDVEATINQVRTMDYDVGILGNNELTHWKNLLVVGITLCARAAIEGGVSPFEAYRVSGFYIRKSSECRDYTSLIAYRNQGIKNLTELVLKAKTRKHTSNHTLQCIDYIHKNYKEKISLDEMAQKIGISGSYLSRLFKREMGMCLQDYIISVKVERAANMLKYSDMSIAIIAEYVGFPTQSYMGKMFKKYMNLTPKQFRDCNKPAEFKDKRRDM